MLPVKLLQSSPTTETPAAVLPTQQAAAEATAESTATAQGGTPEELQQTFAPFWETWTLLHENFVDQPLDDVALMRGAISGMLEATGDKHTTYMNPTEFEQANASMEGEYEGIGAWVDTTGEYVQVISPMKGSPAEAAGLRANDIVIAVNGEDQTGIPGDLVLKKILGPAGEAVTLTIPAAKKLWISPSCAPKLLFRSWITACWTITSLTLRFIPLMSKQLTNCAPRSKSSWRKSLAGSSLICAITAAATSPQPLRLCPNLSLRAW